MTGEQWRRAVVLFEQAVEQPPAGRAQFVAYAAGDDERIRRQVIAMLHADAADHPLLDTSLLHMQAAPDTGPALEGRTVGSYQVVAEVGRGGSAIVYLATDLRHGRSVALKLLNGGATSVRSGERFRREIQLVARLQHPNILPLYDSGEVEGRLFYVMPLAKGGSLRERLRQQGHLPTDEVRRIAREVATALDFAHRHGVVHRDITPANILLDEEHVCVADFGIAHSVLEDDPRQLTLPGVAIGTPAYMSPEQASGGTAIGAHSDVYALGCVVYQMLTGVPPFHADNASGLMVQHAHAPVRSVRTVRPELSPAVDNVLRRALAKDPAARFASATEFVVALDDALVPLGGGADAASWWRRRPLLAAAGGALALLGALLLPREIGQRSALPSIVVLPFANLSDDRANEYFSDGITEELTGALAQLGKLRVTPRTTAFGFKGRTGDLHQIGAELGVSRILEGSVRRDGNRVLVLASLYDAASGTRLWTNRYERDWGSILAVQAEIAGAIAEQLHLKLLPDERIRLAQRHTPNAEAYDSYLRGRHFFDRRTAASLEQAVHHFQQALRHDSLYARAYAGLADSYSILAWTGSPAPASLFARAEVAAQRALAIDTTLAEAHVSLGIIRSFHTWDWVAADRATTRAIAIDPSLASAWSFRAWHLVAAGRREEGLAAIERAQQLEPLSLILNARMATLLTWMGRYAAADSVLQRTLEIDPSYPVARVQRARVLSLMGRHAEALVALPPDSVRFGGFESGIAGFVRARAGLRDEALAAAHALEARDNIPAEGIAAIYAALGDRNVALDWLDRAVASRGPGLIFLDAEPMYASLRSHARYRIIAERVGLGS